MQGLDLKKRLDEIISNNEDDLVIWMYRIPEQYLDSSKNRLNESGKKLFRENGIQFNYIELETRTGVVFPIAILLESREDLLMFGLKFE